MIERMGELARAMPRYLRYVAVSGCALGVDVAVFLAMIAGGAFAAWASGVGYLTGMAAHWLLSSRLVFGATLAEPGMARSRQQALFVASAFAGLALTMAIVGLGDAMGFDPRLAKLAAVAVSFNATYLMRKRLVFA